MSIYGYARMANKKGNLNKQLAELQKYVPESNIFTDIASGSNSDRANYQKLREILKEGDILYISSFERLCRNYSNLKEELEYFKGKSIQLKVLDIPFTMEQVDSGKECLLDKEQEIILNILIYSAELIRLDLKAKQAKGIEMYKREHGGKGAGRPRVEFPDNFNSVYEEYASGNYSCKSYRAFRGEKWHILQIS